MNGLDALRNKVGSTSRPPLVPAVPSMHPRSDAPAPAPDPVEETTVPASQRSSSPKARRATRPRAQWASGPEGQQTEATRTPARRSKVTLNPDQDLWMRGILADAIRDGVRLSEGDVLKLALDRLRASKADWSDLREAILTEFRQRSRRR